MQEQCWQKIGSHKEMRLGPFVNSFSLKWDWVFRNILNTAILCECTQYLNASPSFRLNKNSVLEENETGQCLQLPPI